MEKRDLRRKMVAAALTGLCAGASEEDRGRIADGTLGGTTITNAAYNIGKKMTKTLLNIEAREDTIRYRETIHQ